MPRNISKHVPVICLAQFLLGSKHMEFDKDNNPFKNEFDSKFIGHDYGYLLQLIFEMHKKLEFGLSSKAFYTG